jgi:hypothetical protein
MIKYLASALQRVLDEAAERGDAWLDEQAKSSGMEGNPAFERLRMRQHASLRAAIQGSKPQTERPAPMGGEAKLREALERAEKAESIHAWDEANAKDWEKRAGEAIAEAAKLGKAASLALELIERAAKDAGDKSGPGCPFECHDEDCEPCLPQRAEKALREALASSASAGEGEG